MWAAGGTTSGVRGAHMDVDTVDLACPSCPCILELASKLDAHVLRMAFKAFYK